MKPVHSLQRFNLEGLKQEPLPSIGAAVLPWFEDEARRHGARNLWACASRFNVRAVEFYRRHGFADTAVLPDLVADGFEETLLRKFPISSIEKA